MCPYIHAPAVHTEVKRKKELHQMIPVERVVVLMAAVATAVKRNVKDPEEIAAVYRELAVLQGSNYTPEGGHVRKGADLTALPVVIDVGDHITDSAREAKLQRQYKETISKKPWEQVEAD